MRIKFDKINIFDMEMTCWDTPNIGESEIISIGICEYDCINNYINREQHYYVKPRKSEISSYCTELTGIREKDVRNAPYLEDVCKQIRKTFSSSRPWGAWGQDNVYLSNQCYELDIESPCSDEYINIGGLWTLLSGSGKSVGLKSAMDQLGIGFQGKQHNALVDAINTAYVFQDICKMMNIRLNKTFNSESITMKM
jgi:inhibitor of KinA sporulation pathway (predicted exonuclease)